VAELLGKLLRIQRDSTQFLRPHQPNRNKENSAKETELRVLGKDFRFRRDVQIFAAPAGLQVLMHDSADGGGGFLNPQERDGVAFAAEKVLKVWRFESRNKFQIFSLKDS